MVTVGVLALQGDFAEHGSMLRRLGVDALEVRLPADLQALDALIIPGGESTTITRLIQTYEFADPLRHFGRTKPVWGTCAGAIVMARHATDLDRPTLGLMDMEVRRNAFGRQVDSFETDIPIKGMQGGPLHTIFIRAPIIESVGDGVEVIGRLESGEIVAARQGHLLATSFHPELTDDLRMHALFVSWAAPGGTK
jgi:5'-phosphate synthase pdxT subunit